jgi:uncharacterized glyoxalase superfamily protein PhnB
MAKPDHYLPVMPYIIVDGAEEFITFIEAVFDAKEYLKVAHPDGTLMHAEFGIGEGTIMFTQSRDVYPPFPCGMFVVREDVDETYARGLANGAESMQEPNDAEYGRAAGFQDKWGNVWWLNNPA